jgi:hypothetical protein
LFISLALAIWRAGGLTAGHGKQKAPNLRSVPINNPVFFAFGGLIQG